MKKYWFALKLYGVASMVLVLSFLQVKHAYTELQKRQTVSKEDQKELWNAAGLFQPQDATAKK
jgi:hypothetical protein